VPAVISGGGPKYAEDFAGGGGGGLGTRCTGGGPAASVNDADVGAAGWWLAFGVLRSKRFSPADVTAAAATEPETKLRNISVFFIPTISEEFFVTSPTWAHGISNLLSINRYYSIFYFREVRPVSSIC